MEVRKIADENLIDAIKKIFTIDKVTNYTFVCRNCDTSFDGSEVENFIKHQLDEKHFDYYKVKKT